MYRLAPLAMLHVFSKGPDTIEVKVRWMGCHCMDGNCFTYYYTLDDF